MEGQALIRRVDRWPLGATGFILAVTVLWWGFALFAVPGVPEWVARARAVCFNITESGLPDAKGWLLLVGQPVGMFLTLYAGWKREVDDTLRHLRAHAAGRRLLAGTGVVIVTGLGAAAWRVSDARLPEPSLEQLAAATPFGEADTGLPETYPRLDRPWPASAMAGLVDQTGAPFTLERLEGRRAFVTFAFGHCATVCPMVVHASRSAREGLGEPVSIVVFTLDPWRDTPSRLPALLRQYELDPELDFVVSGPVEAVNRALDAWNVARERDLRTGDIVHPALVYLVEADGTIAYGSTGLPQHLVELAGRLR